MYESTSRNSSKTPIYIALVVSWIIIVVGVWIVFFQDKEENKTDLPANEQLVKYFIGEQVILEGTLSLSDDISQFSHLLTTKDATSFGVKSFDIALNEFSGTVQLKGEVIGFKQQMPIIQVADVIGLIGDKDPSTSGSAAGDSYTYFSSANLGVNLSAFPGHRVAQVGTDIELFDATDVKLLTINYFACTPGSATKDCSVIKNSLEGAQRFTNAAGISFYKFPETERWMAFDGNRFGYTLTAQSGVELQTYGSIFEIVDTTAFDTALDEMKLLCKDINSRLATITTHEVVVAEDGSVKIGIDGSTSDGVAATCVVVSTLANPTRLSLLSYTGPTSPEDTAGEEKIDNTLPVGQNTPPPADTDTSPPLQVPAPAGYETWTTYPSVRGWTMFVERNVVSYQGVLLTGADDVNCPYRLDLAYRTNATGADADSYIYECLPAGATALKSQGYTTIGVATGVEFLRKDLNANLQGIEVYIR